MKSKIFIGDHSSLIIAFRHVAHVELDESNEYAVLNVYIAGVAEPLKLRGVFINNFLEQYQIWGDAT